MALGLVSRAACLATEGKQGSRTQLSYEVGTSIIPYLQMRK